MPATLSRFNTWAIVAVAVTMMAVVGGNIMPGMALWSVQWQHDFGAGAASVMAATTFNQIGSGLIAPFVGYTVGRVSVRNLMLLGLVITATTFVGVAYSTAMWQVTVLYALLLSASMVLCGPVLCQVLAVRLFREKCGVPIGVVTAGMCLSTFTMPPLIGLLLDSGYPWRTVELLMAGLVIALVPLVYFVVRDLPSTSSDCDEPEVLAKPTLGAKEIVTGRTFLAIMMVIIPLFILFNAIYYTLGLYLDQLGTTPTEVSILVGVAGFVAIFGVIGAGYLADRMSHWILLAIATLVLTGAFLFVVTVKSYAVMFVAVPVLDLMIGGLSTLGPAIFAKYYGFANFGLVNGLSRPFFTISSVSPLIAGYLYQGLGDYSLVYLVLMGSLPVSFLGLALLRRPGSAMMPQEVAPLSNTA